MNNKDSNEIISYVESVFLTAGAERMSKYFFDEVFNDVSCEHILWNQDDLYYIVCLLPHNMTSVEVKSSSALDEGYEYLTTLSLTDSEDVLLDTVKSIMAGWTSKEEAILSKYIDLYADNPMVNNIQGILIHTRLRISSREFLYIRNIELSRLFYEMELDSEIDVMYQNYKEALEIYDVADAFTFFCEMCIQVYEKLGGQHHNMIALLYEMLVDYSEFLSIQERLIICLNIYTFDKDCYGNNHMTTLCMISLIASYVCEIGEYEDSILLAKYVYKAVCKKFGKSSEKANDAQGCLIWNYYKAGAYGKALRCAKECLSNCNNNNIDDVIYYKRWIASLYRSKCFEDYETALRYEWEVYNLLESCTLKDFKMKFETMDSIAFSYLKLGKIEEALKTQLALVGKVTEISDKDDVNVVSYYYNLSVILSSAERYEESLKIELPLWSYCNEKLGRFHKDTMNIKNSIIIDLINLDERDLAIQVVREEYLQRQEHLGIDHEATLYSREQYLSLRDTIHPDFLFGNISDMS